MSLAKSLRRIDAQRVELPAGSLKGQRVPAIIFADDELLVGIHTDLSLFQIAGVATLPGIVARSLAMPDVHQGYGFPIGGVAAFDADEGVVSPGGIGFDINCGVRLLASGCQVDDLRPRLRPLLDDLASRLPAGVGRGGSLQLQGAVMTRALAGGARWAVEEGFGQPEDLDFIEQGGRVPGADPAVVSDRARKRGRGQMGSLGGGNHFVEIQYVDQVCDRSAAAAFGLSAGQVVVMLHTGSRGLGHQVASDHVRLMDRAMTRYGLQPRDRQLACAPIRSPEGSAYLSAMACAANYAFANRQVLSRRIRESFAAVAGGDDLRLVYDVSHNIANMEAHEGRRVLVHRKGATRAFGPGNADLPDRYRDVGQPVLVPGSMGTASWVLCGGGDEESFASCCHGAGRRLSRGQAWKEKSADQVVSDLEAEGVIITARSKKGIVEEMPAAYKDVDLVVGLVDRAALARKVARLRPLAVLKG